MNTPRIDRRHFILGGAALAAAGGAGWWARFRPGAPQSVLLSAFEDLPGNQYVGGLVLPEGRVFGRQIPVRAHGSSIDPRVPHRALFFARRPGTQAFALDLATLETREIFTTPAGRHLAGHGLFSPDGRWLYTPEHDYETPRGVVAVRDADDFHIVSEIDTQGLDPHEIAWLPDGRTLVVANGGILTHPRTFRRKLNIPIMDPSLCLIDAATGRCLEQLRLPDHLLSIRHLAVAGDGTVVAGLQYEGEPSTAPSVVAVYRPGSSFSLLDVPPNERPRLNGYVASVALSEAADVIAAACPMGQGLACWRLGSGEFLAFMPAAETYGIAASAEGTLVASQRDGTAFQLDADTPEPLRLQLPRPLRWDDHWKEGPPAWRQLIPADAGVA